MNPRLAARAAGPLLASLVLLAVAPARAKTNLPADVYPASGSYADLTAAIAKAASGATVHIPATPPGTAVAWGAYGTPLVVDRPLTFQGGMGVPGQATHINQGPIFEVTTTGLVVFDHLELEGLQGGPNVAIAVGSQAQVRVRNSTITGGYGGDYYGGAISVRGGTATVVNSTIAGNQAAFYAGVDQTGHGSGPYAYSPINVFSSTVTDNYIGLYVDAIPGMANTPGGSYNLTNSIVAGNLADFQLAFSNVNNYLVFTFNGSNVIGSQPYAPGLAGVEFGTLIGNAFLAALSYNGGGTRTCMPLAESPALGALDGTALSADQRDVPRGAQTAIGAVDAQDALATLADIESKLSGLAPQGGAASQSSVDALAAQLTGLQSSMTGLQSGLGGLATSAQVSALGATLGALDAPVSSRASQASVDALGAAVGGLCTGGQVAALAGTLGAAIGAAVAPLATQAGVTSLSALAAGKLDVAVGTRASAQQADELLQAHLEDALAANSPPIALFFLPATFGGKLDTVQATVHATFVNLAAAGIAVSQSAKNQLQQADAAFVAGHYRAAYTAYGRAYRAAGG